MPRRGAFALAAALLAALPAVVLGAAPQPKANYARARQAWVRATVEGQAGSGAFLELTSARDARLVGAATDAAERVEIHRTRSVDGRMTMRRVEYVDLPANHTVAFERDLHLMLIGLRRQLQPGQVVTLHLQLEDAAGERAQLTVEAPVRPLGAIGPPP